ncbi:hypothetical protein METHPM2_40097 [Pseudomonas sp. PM2]
MLHDYSVGSRLHYSYGSFCVDVIPLLAQWTGTLSDSSNLSHLRYYFSSLRAAIVG